MGKLATDLFSRSYQRQLGGPDSKPALGTKPGLSSGILSEARWHCSDAVYTRVVEFISEWP